MKTDLAALRLRNGLKAEADRIGTLVGLASQRINDAHLIDPEHDSALYYVQEALRLDPNNGAAMDTEKALAARLLTEAHGAIDARNFARFRPDHDPRSPQTE